MRITNIAWNLGGLGVPLIVALLTVPSLIKMIGMERFGLLSLAWGLIGFAGVFDLGIGRATTQAIAGLRGSNQLDQVPSVFKTAETLSFRSGLVGTFLLVIAILAGIHTHIKYAVGLESEVTSAAYLLALVIPVQSMSAMFRGVNEAFENFREISILRIGLGVTNFFGPFCMAIFTTHLAALVSIILFSRLLAFFLFRKFAVACAIRHLRPDAIGVSVQASSAIAKQLRSFGGWFTVSCLSGPVLIQADRFFIGTLISATAVASYTIPYEFVTQSLIIVGAISSVAFPNLSALIHSRPHEVAPTFRRWLRRIGTLMFIVASLCALLLPVILPWWIGSNLSAESVLIGQILCIGVFANSLGSIYFALLHAYGRADITAKLHLFEIPLYLVSLYFLVATYGAVGAAIGWVGRTVLDTLLIWFAYKLEISSNAKYQPL